MLRTKFIVALLLIPLSARGADVYFAKTAAGAGDGTSCVNAEAVPASWTAGTTYHICTTGWTAYAANTTAITISSSGTSGSPITIIADQGAVTLQAPYFSASGAIIISGSYVTLNGDGNLTIENTDNGTGLTYETASGGLNVSGANVTVEKLTISDICQHTSPSDLNGCVTGGNGDGGIFISGANDTVTLNTVHDTATGIWIAGGANNAVVSNNTVYRTNWGIAGLNAGITSNVAITGNDISCIAGSATCNWDTTNDASFHHNGMMFFPQSGSVTGLAIGNNYIHDINGSYGGVNEETAHIFLDPGGTGSLTGPTIYNNVLVTTVGSGPSNAFITDGAGVSGALILNNTIYGKSSQAISGQVSPTSKNNLMVGSSAGAISSLFYLNSGYSSVASDYNDFYNGTNVASVSGGSTYTTLTSWQGSGVCTGGCDTNSINSSPNLSATYTLNSGSPAIGAGANLTSLSISGLDQGAPQYFGVSYACGTGCLARPSTGAWDMGAYPYASAPVSSPGADPIFLMLGKIEKKPFTLGY